VTWSTSAVPRRLIAVYGMPASSIVTATGIPERIDDAFGGAAGLTMTTGSLSQWNQIAVQRGVPSLHG
jgi:hypothetical protein